MTMNYLFTVPKSTRSGVGTDPKAAFPVGAAYVAAAMRVAGFSVFGFNPFISRPGDITKKLQENKVDVLCISAFSWFYPEVEALIRKIKALFPKMIIVLGGNLVSSEPEIVMESIGADYGVMGQGEITMVELAKTLELARSGIESDYGTIDGLVHKSVTTGDVIVNRPRMEIKNLDALPFPAYDLFNLSEHVEISGFVPIVASRGCPGKCTFCYQPTKKYVQRNLDNVFDEICHWKSKTRGKIDNVVIYDELFGVKKNHVKEFCQRIKEIDIKFTSVLRVDIIDEEICSLLKEAGCSQVTLGLESMDDRILKSMKKNISVAQIKAALRLTNKMKLLVNGSFIFGDIEETIDTANATIKWWEDHSEFEKIGLYMINVLPGSYIYHHAVQQGIISNKLNYLKAGCPLINASKLSEDQFQYILKNYHARYHSTPVCANNMQIKKLFDCAFEGLIEIECPNCGNISKSHSRLYTDRTTLNCNQCNKLLVFCPSDFVSKQMLVKLLTSSLEKMFRPFANENKRILIYSMGSTALCLLMASPTLKSCIVGFAGNDYANHPNGFWGFKVFNPKELTNNSADYILIANTIHADEIRDTIEKELGLSIPIIDLDFSEIY